MKLPVQKFMTTLGLCAAAMSFQAIEATAAVVTHGFLSSDDTTNVIVDSNTNRHYTRLDAFNWTVADTEAALGSGGAFEGWSVATSNIMDEFIAAALGVSSTSCDGDAAFGTRCGTIAGWQDADFGASYYPSYDYIGFYNTYGGSPIGLVEIRHNCQVRDYDGWAGTGSLDAYNINLMLYQEVSEETISPVPVPASLPLLAAGFGIFGLMRRKRKAA